MFEKERARERAKETRANIHKNDDGMAARKVAAKIIMLEELDTLKTVSAYCPINDELDALVTLKALHAARFPIALPAITDKDQPLEFRNWDMRTDLFDGPFNTKVSSEETVVPDALLIPLLAFDEHGNRLGYGGGFYDRTIASLKIDNPELITIGIAYDGQKIAHLPVDDYDQILDMIVTDRAIYKDFK